MNHGAVSFYSDISLKKQAGFTTTAAFSTSTLFYIHCGHADSNTCPSAEQPDANHILSTGLKKLSTAVTFFRDPSILPTEKGCCRILSDSYFRQKTTGKN
ncbi:hypothetical protein [Acinetobacter sp. WZC-1]|uniref:hypothetical protein n=1 Tax=Acinetobacter sp. WZC-1 TaxID=3459034 RepID=UPI00403D57D7